MVEAYNYDGTMSLNDVRRESLKQISALQDQIDQINQSLTSVQGTVDAQATAASNFSGIVNTLDNSLPEWSKIAYDTPLDPGPPVIPSDAGDGNMECKDFYRQLTSDAPLSPASATALKTAKTVEPADHSLWGSPNEATNLDIPRWNKTNAWIEMGGVSEPWDIYYPIPNDIIFPGQRFTFQFEALVDPASTSPLPTLQFYAGFYDSTPGHEKYIEGGDFKISDDKGNDPGVTYGIPGSTSVDYRVVALTDSGEEAISQVLNFPNAPAVFDQNNHPRIRFTGVAGFIEFQIYRRIGTVYVRQFTVRNSIDGTYFDVGNPPEAYVPGWPAVTTTAPRAYAVTTNFVAGTLFGLGYVRNAMTILVPTTYNRSLTAAGQQYLRFGLTGPTATARQVHIRKLGLSMGDGNWARSSNDTRAGAHSTPSGSAAESSPPSGGSGGSGGIDPPPPPSGGYCVVTDTPVRMADGEIPFRELQATTRSGKLIDAGGPVHRRVFGVRVGHASYVLRVEAENGCKVRCTPDEPFITDESDAGGTPLVVLQQRMADGKTVMVLTKPGEEVMRTKIVSIVGESGDFTVGEPTVDGGIYIAGGFLFHNKPVDLELP
jgi:hypothetical protein